MKNRTEAKTSPELASLGQDWLTLWQSEIAAMLADREQWEHWRLLAGLWSAAALALPHVSPADPAHADSAAPPRPAPAAAAPAAGGPASDDETRRLRQRVVELEQRLANLERAADS